MKPQFSWQTFEKYSDIKFHENASCESQVPYRWTGKRDAANSRFLQFCKDG